MRERDKSRKGVGEKPGGIRTGRGYIEAGRSNNAIWGAGQRRGGIMMKPLPGDVGPLEFRLHEWSEADLREVSLLDREHMNAPVARVRGGM